MEGHLEQVADGNEDWVSVLAALQCALLARAGGSGRSRTALAKRATNSTDDTRRPMRLSDGYQDGSLRQVHLVNADILSGRHHAADRQKQPRQCPNNGGARRRVLLAQGAHVLRLRELSQLRLHLVGPRDSRTLPRLLLIRRREDDDVARRSGMRRQRDDDVSSLNDGIVRRGRLVIGSDFCHPSRRVTGRLGRPALKLSSRA